MAQTIDLSGIRGSAAYLMTYELPSPMVLHLSYRRSGVVYVLDHPQILAGALTPDAVRSMIDSDLNERAAMASEAEQGMEIPTETIAIEKDMRANRTAAITVESITSPRTGRKGWRVTYAA